MKELLEKLKWYKSNLTVENLSEFKVLIADMKKQLPESYQLKFELLTFYEKVNEDPFIDLPF
jgi:hypothetical protein